MRGWRRLTLALMAGLAIVGFAPEQVSAQGVEAGIVGTVSGSEGEPIAAVLVSVRNESTGFRWQILTNAAGRFAILRLPLGGPYSVIATGAGYRTSSRSGFQLDLGDRIVVDLQLETAPIALEPLVVAGDELRSRGQIVGANYRVGGDQIEAIPSVGRNFTDLTSLAPTTGVQGSILGQRWTSTDIRVDGAQSRNMLRAGEYGAGPYTLSLEAIREFDVSSNVYDVAHGRNGGGSIRAATRSGSNTFTGSLFAYHRGSRLSAGTDFQGRDRAAREFAVTQWGGSSGGPLLHDRLHFFVAFDRQDSREPVFTGDVRGAADELATGIARDSLDRLLGILTSRYGLDDSRPQLGRLDRSPYANTSFARLDWQLSNSHHLMLRHDYSGWNSPLSGGVDQPITLLEARSDYRSAEHQWLATLRSSLGTMMQNELKLSISASNRRLTPLSDLPRGFVRVQSALSNGTRGDVRVQFGGNRLAPDDSREFQVQLIDQAFWQRGNVLFTVGTDNTLTRLETFIAEAQSGLFEFESLADLEARRPTRYSRTMPLIEASPATRQSVLEVSVYGQAEWQLSPRVTITGGLRWDGSAFLDAPAANPAVLAALGASTDQAPADWTKLQPRLQMVWDVAADGRQIVRVGGGRFAAQMPYYAQHNQLLNDGFRIADIVLTGAAIPTPDYIAYRHDPSSIPRLPASSAAPPAYVNLVADNFRTPGIWKASASYQRRFDDWLTVTASLIGSRTTDNYQYFDRNLRVDPAFTLDNERGRGVFVPASTIPANGRTLNSNSWHTPALGRVLELTSAGRATQQAAVLETTLRHGGAWVNAAYTYNRARDNSTYGCCLARTATTFTAIRDDPRDLSASWGPSDTDFRHKVVIAGALPAVLGVKASGRYVGSNGRPFSAVVNGDINGDESTSNDLAFVFDPDDPATAPDIAAAMRRVLANPDNVARDYLRRYLGQVAGRNGAIVPWISRIDLRVSRAFPTTRGQHLELIADVYNFANLLNRDWGAQYLLPVGISNQNPVIQRIPLLNVIGFDQATRRYRYTVNENFGVLQKGGEPYQIQLGVRYSF